MTDMRSVSRQWSDGAGQYATQCCARVRTEVALEVFCVGWSEVGVVCVAVEEEA